LTPSQQQEFAERLLTLYGPAEVERALGNEITLPTLCSFVEATVVFQLHPWQRDHLCPILERLRTERGLRIALHGPPQYGKSVITSQRLPAYLIGCDPTARVGLACYNETHATGFGQVIKDLLLGQEFIELFPDARCRITKDAPAARFATAGRQAQADAQPSFLAMGLLSGFTGKGVDHLIIDDPYKSADDARSATINEKVWRWWSQTAGPRIPDTTNVVVMFHRYHEDDFAGRLLQEGFEYVRFPAIADTNPDGSDPTGRRVGELLSPMRSQAWLDKQRERDAITFAGQFQGTPLPDEGGFFNAERFTPVDALEVPAGLLTVRAWDLAATQDAGDWTVGVKMGMDVDGGFWVLDVVRGRWSTDRRNLIIRQTAEQDGVGVVIHGPQDPGAAGVEAAQAFVRLLRGFKVRTERVSGSKAVRADAYSAQVNGGNVRMVRAPWNPAFKAEHKAFIPDNAAGVDDQIDAAADAFNRLAGRP
jgi:predicted phage terminase large subunit-like protein